MKIAPALSFLWETLRIVIVAVLIIAPVRMFLFQPFFVRGASMEPNFHNGDYLIIDEISYRFREPDRGEVVVFRYPQDPSQFYIKRIIGLPGETVRIEGGRVLVARGTADAEALNEQYLARGTSTGADTTLILGPGEYFMMGDNRAASSDSRRWGAVSRRHVVGRTLLTLWPVQDFEVFAAPTY